MAEKLGRSGCKTPGPEEGDGRVGAPDLSHPASYVDRRYDIPNGGSADDLISIPSPA